MCKHTLRSERIARGPYVVQRIPFGDRWYIPIQRAHSQIDVIQEPVAQWWRRAKANAGGRDMVKHYTYEVGDRVRIIARLYYGAKATVTYKIPQSYFYKVLTDAGDNWKYCQNEIEPLRWWKFWRSRRV